MSSFKPNTDKKIIFHGNSLFNYKNGNIPYGWDISNYVRDNLIVKKAVFDYSQGGKTSTQIVSEFPTRIAPYFKSGDIYIFWDTINDLNTGKTVTQTIANTKAVALLAKNLGMKVFTLNCININNAIVEPLRVSYNNQIILEPIFCDGIIDVASIAQLSTYTNLTYFNADGVHLTTAGYNLIAQKILTSI